LTMDGRYALHVSTLLAMVTFSPLAAAQSLPEETSEVQPAAQQPEPAAQLVTPNAATLVDELPAPFGGFGLQPGRLGATIEFGYPFFGLQMAYGLPGRVELGVAYRGLYALTHSPVGIVRVRLFENDDRTAAFGLTVRGGYTIVGDDQSELTGLVGGAGPFGELEFNIGVRNSRHMLFVTAGVRLSQNPADYYGCPGGGGYETYPATGDDDNCFDLMPPWDGDAPLVATGYSELGYGLRFMRAASFFVAAGVDMFFDSNELPAMIRLRTGMTFDM
jgi:hypothetical protein